MAEYFLSNKAVEDLSKIWEYTLNEWSETQADRYYYMLLDACSQLADEKINGRNYAEVEEDVYGFMVGKHIIFYRKINRGDIEIARILHSRMDLKSRMQE